MIYLFPTMLKICIYNSEYFPVLFKKATVNVTCLPWHSVAGEPSDSSWLQTTANIYVILPQLQIYFNTMSNIFFKC